MQSLRLLNKLEGLALRSSPSQGFGERREVKFMPKKSKEEKEVKEEQKADKKLQDLAEKIESLTLSEAAQLSKTLQEKFGITTTPQVTATPTIATGPTPSAASTEAGGEAPSEQTTFNVILANSGANKISVIKALREINPQLGLKEAKDIADAPPKEILTGVNKETAEEAKQKLEAAGAQVELK